MIKQWFYNERPAQHLQKYHETVWLVVRLHMLSNW